MEKKYRKAYHSPLLQQKFEDTATRQPRGRVESRIFLPRLPLHLTELGFENIMWANNLY